MAEDTMHSRLTLEAHQSTTSDFHRSGGHAAKPRGRVVPPSKLKRKRTRRRRPAQPWHPRYWPMHVGLALLRMTVLTLPFEALLTLGKWVGRLAYVVAPYRRHVADTNLKLCFPDLPARVRHQRVRRHFEALGMGLFELGLTWWGKREDLAHLLQLEGIEHLQRAHAQGQGVLLLSCHMTFHELTAALLANHAPVPPMAIYRPFKNPVLERAAARGRGRHARLVNRRRALVALRYLKNGGCVWYAPDQSEGRGRVLVPFFAEPKVMNTGAARMVRATGALAIPIHQIRLPGRRGYRVIIRPPLEGFPTGDPVADATRLIQVVEEQVGADLDHYSWAHTRFRDRKGLLPNPYGR